MQYQAASMELRSPPPQIPFWAMFSEALVLAAVASLLTLLV
jgi:hypothetical protein